MAYIISPRKENRRDVIRNKMIRVTREGGRDYEEDEEEVAA